MGRNNGEFSAGQGPNYFGNGIMSSPYSGGASWKQHAIGHGIVPSTEPGNKWGPRVALVPVSQLMRYREFDRASDEYSHGSKSTQTIADLTNEFRTHGVSALREPLYLSYDHKEKWGYLGEGNHRLAAAVAAGITHLPVKVNVSSGKYGNSNKEQGIGAPLHMDNRLYEQWCGFVPDEAHPGNFMEFEGAK
jgi:hypothetical protein